MKAESIKHLLGRTLWRLPFPFSAAKVLGSRYSLRCVLFHDVSDRQSSLTDGLGVTLNRRKFEDAIRFLARHYAPVSLEEVLNPSLLRQSSRQPVLVTFDDAYASVALEAAPICRKYGVPGLFFVNARFLDNRELALDNLVCHVANTLGFDPISAVASGVLESKITLRSFTQIFGEFLPTLALKARQAFYDGMANAAGGEPQQLAQQAGLYLTSAQLRELASFNFEIGNHTYSHVYGRTLVGEDLREEIDRNRSALESVTGNSVRAFSVPYGSSADLPPELARHLHQTGHEAAFLVESLTNTPSTDLGHLFRVSIAAGDDADLFSELEIMPRLRSIRDALL